MQLCYVPVWLMQFEAQDVKELRMIFDGQNDIHRLVKHLLVKLDEVIGRQERELSMLTIINQGSPGGIQANQVYCLRGNSWAAIISWAYFSFFVVSEMTLNVFLYF